MKLIDHIQRCNSFEPSRYRRFDIAGRRIGSIEHNLAARLTAFPEVFTVRDDCVRLDDRLATPEARTAALADVIAQLRKDGPFPKPRGEIYRVVDQWGETPLLLIDRSAVSAFGLRAFGVHLNGFVRQGGTIKLWIAQRAADREVEPDKLDNMVAGGQPAGLGLQENPFK